MAVLDRIYGGALVLKVISVHDGKQNRYPQGRPCINHDRMLIEDKVISNFPLFTFRTRCILSQPVMLDAQFYTHIREEAKRGMKEVMVDPQFYTHIREEAKRGMHWMGNERATGRGVIYT